MTDGLRVLLAGGGTGGHLRPALTLAQALVESSEPSARARCVLLVSGRSVEDNFLNASVGRGDRVRVERLFPGFGSRPAPWRAGAYLHAWRLARRIRQQFQPDITLLFGGYVSAFALAGRRRHHPTVLFESNAMPGRVTRWLSKHVSSVIAQWETTGKELSAKTRLMPLGMPIDPAFFRGEAALSSSKARTALGLEPDRFTLLFLGGSLGALAINDLAQESLPQLDGKLQALIIAGDRQADRMREAAASWTVPSRVLSHCERMDLAYAASDLAICRAGGMTVTELAVTGTPAILVPYPHHADQHQKANALELVNVGAARLCEQGEATSEKLVGWIRELAEDPKELSAMGESARHVAKPDSLENTVEWLRDTIAHSTPGTRQAFMGATQ